MRELGDDNRESKERCPQCDSVVTQGQDQCLMCGFSLQWESKPAEQDAGSSSAQLEIAETDTNLVQDDLTDDIHSADAVIVFEMQERLSPITYILTAFFAVIVVIIGILVLMYPADAAIEFIPTPTELPVIAGVDETAAKEPTETIEPTYTPTPEDTPLPTDTPHPPINHTVSSGETLFGLSLRYEVSMESIAEENGIPVDTALQVSQELLIPWPTATPPLVPVEVEIGDEVLIADPTGCEIYEIKGGDTLFGIAASFDLPPAALLEVNRLSEISVLQPGDTICIPNIIYGAAGLATAGPSPTPGPTMAPRGPELLYPTANTLVEGGEGIISTQWIAVKDLGLDEWYMLELTDLSKVDSHPRRAFTRQNSFQIPDDWAPLEPGVHDIRWRVSIVRITDQRSDGSFIYTFGGESSDDAYFSWKIES